MRRNYFSSIALVMVLFTWFKCNAQEEIDINIEKVNNLSEPEAIDMGGSVLWASFNLYADEPTDVGIYCGWGDPTGKLQFQASDPDGENYIDETACSAMYGGLKPAYNISGSELDIVHSHLGSDWILPEKWHFDELHDCKWEIIQLDKGVGYKVTAQNGNSIFLPAWNDNIEKVDGKDVIYGAYWTSNTFDLFEPVMAYGFDLSLVRWWLKSDTYDCESIEVDGENQLTAYPRWLQLMIRPVKLKK